LKEKKGFSKEGRKEKEFNFLWDSELGKEKFPSKGQDLQERQIQGSAKSVNIPPIIIRRECSRGGQQCSKSTKSIFFKQSIGKFKSRKKQKY